MVPVTRSKGVSELEWDRSDEEEWVEEEGRIA